ncbi:MAG: hypothetical protein LBL95_03485 [Deltaproteobacteria bacterium]|nr:hypothetical protein [Deltaproteobacteria bacterium]
MSEQAPARPSLRCPGCGGTVFMPATDCPACGFNFRLGRKPVAPAAASGMDMEAPGGRNRLVMIAGAAALVLLVAAIAFLVTRPEKPDAPSPSAASGHVLPPPADDLLVQSPTLHPAVPINRAKGVADQADARVQEMKNIDQEFGQE